MPFPARASAWLLGSIAALTAASRPAAAEDYVLDTRRSLVAVVTHGAGIAAPLLSEHLIVSKDASASARFVPGDQGATRLTIEVPVATLAIDDPEVASTWGARLKVLGVLDEVAVKTDEQRGLIRKAVLAPERLDAARHPTIRAELLHLKENRSTFEGWTVTHTGAIALTINGRTHERPIGVKLTPAPDFAYLDAEAIGRIHLPAFGVAPYAAWLGAARLAEDAHLVVIARLTRGRAP